MTLRVAALRNKEGVMLNAAGADPSRGAVTVYGDKAGHMREMPLHRPLLAAILDHNSGIADNPALFRTSRGCRISGGRFDDGVSLRLHAEAAWAQGHDLAVHVLRHTTARAVEARFGRQSAPVILYLGHSVSYSRVVAAYLHSPYQDEWTLRRIICEATFGWNEWPTLPEAASLRLALPELPLLPDHTPGLPPP